MLVVAVRMRRTSRYRARSAGFTLVEMLAVVAIVGILAVLAITSYVKWNDWAKTASTRDIVVHIASAQEQYNADTDGYLDCSSSYTDYYPLPPSPEKRMFQNQGHIDYPCFRHFHVDAESATYSGFVVIAGNPGEALQQPPTKQKINLAPPAGKPWYIVYAATDLDGDGELEMMYTSSFQPSEVHIENQGE